MLVGGLMRIRVSGWVERIGEEVGFVLQTGDIIQIHWFLEFQHSYSYKNMAHNSYIYF